ncbi:MAG TPA: hypothetical protein VKU01_01210 [Bryobacteraceae bacterium]|nr:hypothetical protein [Bryobacteraceae bacterium]
MKCSDCQLRIASEFVDSAVAEHLAGCGECREFAEEMAKNQEALRSVHLDPAALTAVRARVMAGIRPRRRFGWVWELVPAAVAVAFAAVMLWPKAPQIGRPDPVVFAKHVPDVPVPAPAPARRIEPARVPAPRRDFARAAHTLRMEIETGDPNVKIIWLIDEKGESL